MIDEMDFWTSKLCLCSCLFSCLFFLMRIESRRMEVRAGLIDKIYAE